MSEENDTTEDSTPAKPVPNPDLPDTGDSDYFEEEPILEKDLSEHEESQETPEQPNDLSGIEKEFED